MGPRVYVAGYRLHHGAVGFALALLGVGLMLHDWKDRPWPLRDR